MSAPLAPGWAPSPVQGEFCPPSSPTLGQDILGLSHPYLCWLLSGWCPAALLSPWFERGEDKTLPFARQFYMCPCSLNFSQGKRVVQRLRGLFNLPGMTLCHRTQGDWPDGRSKHREAFTWEKSPHARVSSLLRVETSRSRNHYQAVPGCLPAGSPGLDSCHSKALGPSLVGEG